MDGAETKVEISEETKIPQPAQSDKLVEDSSTKKQNEIHSEEKTSQEHSSDNDGSKSNEDTVTDDKETKEKEISNQKVVYIKGNTCQCMHSSINSLTSKMGNMQIIGEPLTMPKCYLQSKGPGPLRLVPRTNNGPGKSPGENENIPCSREVLDKLRNRLQPKYPLYSCNPQHSPYHMTSSNPMNPQIGPQQTMGTLSYMDEYPDALLGATGINRVDSTRWEAPEDLLEGLHVDQMFTNNPVTVREELCTCIRLAQNDYLYQKLQIYNSYENFDAIINGYESEFMSPLLLAVLCLNIKAYEYLLSCIQVNVLLPHRDWNTVFHIIAEGGQFEFLATMLTYLEKFPSRKTKTIAILKYLTNKNGETVYNIVLRKMAADPSLAGVGQCPFMNVIHRYLTINPFP